MDTQTALILKVFVISAVVSAAIKYVGPNLGVATTPVNALISVLTPTLMLAIALLWRMSKYGQSN
jgi:small basic protein